MLLLNGSDAGVLTSFLFGTDSDTCVGGEFGFDHRPQG